MQQLFMFIDWGEGWTPVNDHAHDLAALDGLTIRWGTDDPAEQPDPAVCSFTLHDRTGDMAGMAATLAGARVIVQMSEQPTWDDMPARPWNDYPATRLRYLYNEYVPPNPDNVDSPLVTLFDGIVASGGTARWAGGRSWNLDLTASSRMILWKRSQAQGPTSTDARWDGYHWVGTPAERLAEIRSRAAAAGLPALDVGSLGRPPAVVPHEVGDSPSLLDLVHTMYATQTAMPLWSEYPERASSRIGYIAMNGEHDLHMAPDGILYVRDGEEPRTALDADGVIGGETYTVPAPLTQITYKTHAMSLDDDGKVEIEDADTTCTDMGLLPANLTSTQSSMTIETDVPVKNDAGGYQWIVYDSFRRAAANWLYAVNMRLRAEGMTFDSRRIDPTDRPYLYVSAPSGPITFAGALGGQLTGSDDRPAFTGVWTTIGGVLTFRWVAGDPVLRHEVNLWPLRTTATDHTWDSIADWPARWRDVSAIVWDEMALVQQFDKE